MLPNTVRTPKQEEEMDYYGVIALIVYCSGNYYFCYAR